MVARSTLSQSNPSSDACRAGGSPCTIGPNRRSDTGGAGFAEHLSGPDRGAASEEFPLENRGRHRPLSRRAAEGRRTPEEFDPRLARFKAIGLKHRLWWMARGSLLTPILILPK